MEIKYCMAQKDICSICSKVTNKINNSDQRIYYCQKDEKAHESVSMCEDFECNATTKCVKCYFCDYKKDN